jgi:hypothetical protein
VTKKRSYSEEVGDAIEAALDACGDPTDTAAEDWAAWRRGDRLRHPHKHAVPQDVEIAHDIHNWLYHDGALTQTKFAEALRRFNNEITNLFSELLAPGGHEDWKLTLKQSRRGAPRKGDPLEVMVHFYYQFVEEHGERGAVKRFAKKYGTTPEAVRSALRRDAGTHDKRRRHWSDDLTAGGVPLRRLLQPSRRLPRKRGRKK